MLKRAAVAISLAIIASGAIAAPDASVQTARAAIANLLKDPTSARFEGIERRPGAVCGFVNSKNSFGGYTGRKPFVYLIAEKKGWVLEAPMAPVDAAPALAAAEKHCAGVKGF